MSSNFIKYPFCDKGDKALVPDIPTAEDLVNFEYGYNQKYQEDPKSGGVYINRLTFNGLMYQLSEPIQDLQLNGVRAWEDGISYPMGAMARIGLNVITGQPAQLDTTNGLIQPVIIKSLKADNGSNPYTLANALNNEWSLVDGYSFLDVRYHGNTLNLPMAGYILLTSSDIATKVFAYDDYRWLELAMRNLAAGERFSYFEKINGTTFKALDLRAKFAQGYPNGSTLDANRQFGEAQGGGLPNIKTNFGNPWQGVAIFGTKAQVDANPPFKWKANDLDFAAGSDTGGTNLDFSTLPSPHNYSDSINRAVQPDNYNASIMIKVTP